MKHNLAIGADIGGSHISCAAIDLTTGKILKNTLTGRSVNNRAHAFEIIGVWSNAVKESISKVPGGSVKGIGFAMPGPFDYVKGISYIKGVQKYENLFGFNIGDAIKSSLEAPEDFEVRFMNDASSFAVGEAWAGKGAKYGKIMCITLGTGFGSAFIDEKIPVVDGESVPKIGCVYHLPYRDSIADDYFSTRGLLKSYKEATGKDLPGAKELAELAKNDKVVQSIFRKFGDDMGGFLSTWLNKFGAEILVIGGNISFAYKYFGKPFEDRLKKEKCKCNVALSELKEDAALLGAAYLFNDYFWEEVQHALPLM
jgi:glucokinase